ncbi:MAG: Regulatory protein MsrR [Parcubacteria group bacterium ADurb.Bin305]|jgi:LCP family protein required for cell wall assembly|nr:MAG: Regulatory protein MsrR [Parcubacteria group bacterium ADurb.Bin305]
MMRIKRILLIIGILILSLGASFLLWGARHPKEFLLAFSSNGPINSLVNKLTASPINILVLGIAGQGSRGGLLTDTIMVVQLNPAQQKIALISIPRDLYVKNPFNNQPIKINSIYASENTIKSFPQATSFQNITSKVEDITGLPINYTIIFDLEGFGQLVDLVGGVTIWLDENVYDPTLVNPYNPTQPFYLAKGWHNLDGALAIKLVRSRYASSGDFFRIKHQQQIMLSLKDKLLNLPQTMNLSTIASLWRTLQNHFVTDLNINEAINLVRFIKNNNIANYRLVTMVLDNKPPNQLLISTSIPLSSDNQQTMYALLPKLGFEKYDEIHKFIQNQILLNNE